MKIQDYLQFYLGCDYRLKNDISGHTAKIDTFTLTNFHKVVIPILRPLSSITEHEKIQAAQAWHSVDGDNWMQDAARTKFLLSKHFDLFNLIPSGLALDATKLTTPVK